MGAEGVQLRHDIDEYVAGINQYISEARLDPTKMPGEYAAIGRPQGPACVQSCPHGSAVRISFKDLVTVSRTLSQ